MLLQRYLRFKYGDDGSAARRFGEGLMMLSYTRERVDIEDRRLPV